MAKQTKKTGDDFSLPHPPKMQSGKEIYDSIMEQVEPELTTKSLPRLKKKYNRESKNQKEERKQRYNVAFIRYYELYEAYIEDLDTRIRRYHKNAMRSIEDINNSLESGQMHDLAASFFKL